jgi:hypothetical protein
MKSPLFDELIIDLQYSIVEIRLLKEAGIIMQDDNE